MILFDLGVSVGYLERERPDSEGVDDKYLHALVKILLPDESVQKRMRKWQCYASNELNTWH